VRFNFALILLLGAVLWVGANWLTKGAPPVPRTLPAAEPAQHIAVAAQIPATAPSEDANPDWMGAIDQAASFSGDEALVELFSREGLPATAKAHLIDAALQRQDIQLLRDAEELLRKMVRSGTAADVLAAIPKVAYFAEDTAKDIAALQESLCRFQSSSADELGFEMIKVKFNMVLGKEPNVKPWTAVCGAS
jgi:hypothetical protein